MTWTAELAREIEGQVLTDDATREAMATDFGRVIVRKPQVVVRPASSKDVARVVKFVRTGRRARPNRWSHPLTTCH